MDSRHRHYTHICVLCDYFLFDYRLSGLRNSEGVEKKRKRRPQVESCGGRPSPAIPIHLTSPFSHMRIQCLQWKPKRKPTTKKRNIETVSCVVESK